MRERIALALVLTGLIAWATGCKKQVDQAEFKSAINKSFAGRHECVWPEPIKLPAQADASKDEKTRDYDTLTDAGLLIASFAFSQEVPQDYLAYAFEMHLKPGHKSDYPVIV